MSIFYITDIFSRLYRVASRYYIVHIRINTALRHFTIMVHLLFGVDAY